MEMVHKTKLAREEQAALVLFMEEAVEGILGREAAWFNDDDRFQSAVHSMLGIKQGVAKLPTDGILDLSRRDSIVSLPEGIGGLGALKALYLGGCTSLASLPEGIGGLGALKKLNLEGCTSLVSLPLSCLSLLESRHVFGLPRHLCLPGAVRFYVFRTCLLVAARRCLPCRSPPAYTFPETLHTSVELTSPEEPQVPLFTAGATLPVADAAGAYTDEVPARSSPTREWTMESWLSSQPLEAVLAQLLESDSLDTLASLDPASLTDRLHTGQLAQQLAVSVVAEAKAACVASEVTGSMLNDKFRSAVR
jgi:hypothetical protein